MKSSKGREERDRVEREERRKGKEGWRFHVRFTRNKRCSNIEVEEVRSHKSKNQNWEREVKGQSSQLLHL